MQVNHSQRLSEQPVTHWVIAEPSGKIICAHCDCMVRLEVCNMWHRFYGLLKLVCE